MVEKGVVVYSDTGSEGESLLGTGGKENKSKFLPNGGMSHVEEHVRALANWELS
jgi:hypothetical protein